FRVRRIRPAVHRALTRKIHLQTAEEFRHYLGDGRPTGHELTKWTLPSWLFPPRSCTLSIGDPLAALPCCELRSARGGRHLLRKDRTSCLASFDSSIPAPYRLTPSASRSPARRA